MVSLSPIEPAYTMVPAIRHPKRTVGDFSEIALGFGFPQDFKNSTMVIGIDSSSLLNWN